MTPRMPVLYTAGPYRGPTRDAVQINIASARAAALLAARKGWSVVCPHMNSANLDAADPAIGDDFWLASTMELMRRCDAVLLLPGWSQSSGTRAEYEEACRLGIEVYTDVDNMPTATDFADTLGIRFASALGVKL